MDCPVAIGTCVAFGTAKANLRNFRQSKVALLGVLGFAAQQVAAENRFHASTCVFMCHRSGHGVVAAASPGVTAQYAPDGQVQAFQRAVFLDGFDGILRTGGGETAGRRKHGRNEPLVKADGQNEQAFEHGKQGYFDKSRGTDRGCCRTG